MSTHVRRMRWEDIPQVRGIDLACFPTMMPPTNYEMEYINPMAHYLVAYDEAVVPLENASGERLQTILGFIGLWLMAGEIHIINLAVTPHTRRQEIRRGSPPSARTERHGSPLRSRCATTHAAP